MSLRFFLPLLAAGMLAASAQAADPDGHNGPQGPGFSPEDMAKHHAFLCNGGYARAVGEMAATEVRLQLTAKQKPLFEAWKKAKLAAAGAMQKACLSAPPPAPPPVPPDGHPGAGKFDAPTSVERLKREQTHLEARLAAVRAELPALEALDAVLGPEQRAVLGPAVPPHGGFGPGPERGFDRPVRHDPAGGCDHN